MHNENYLIKSETLEDIADAIREKKESEELIAVEDFANEIANLPSGTSTPTSPLEFDENVHNTITSFYEYALSLPQTYQTYTNEQVTLYTPNINFKHYIIQKRSSGKYRVAWFKYDFIIYDDGIKHLKWVVTNTQGDVELASLTQSKIYPSIIAQDDYYISSEYDTVEECIQKMLNNELTYTTASTFLGAIKDSPYIIPYSNVAILDKANQILNSQFVFSKRISQNETIVSM